MQINKIWLYLAGGEAKTAYVDNVYFSSSSTLSAKAFGDNKYAKAFVSSEGKISFNKDQSSTKIAVYDLMGRLVLSEKINGIESIKSLSNKGIYILKLENNEGISSQKVAY